MLSYAQNGEDVVLRRAFAAQGTGFYLDVGACHPVLDSVTAHFYAQGWHGVNVEPDPALHAELAAQRPRDENLRLAVGRERGRVDFHPTGTRGHGTLDATLACARSNGRPPERVRSIPLCDVIALYGPDAGEIDFLKIDVEGWEADVIASGDWTRHRPRVVLVEAVDLCGRPTHETWEPELVSAGYRFVLFDGLNRFYCREEDAEHLLPLLAAPANVFDNWRKASDAEGEARAAAAEQRVASAEASAANAAARVASTEARAAALGADIEQARADAATARRRAEETAVLQVELARCRGEAAAALRREEQAEARAATLEMQATGAAEETERRLAVLQVELARSHGQAAAALHREEQAEARAATLEMQVARAAAARDEAERLLHAMRTATTWRLMAPVRRVIELARGSRHAN